MAWQLTHPNVFICLFVCLFAYVFVYLFTDSLSDLLFDSVHEEHFVFLQFSFVQRVEAFRICFCVLTQEESNLDARRTANLISPALFLAPAAVFCLLRSDLTGGLGRMETICSQVESGPLRGVGGLDRSCQQPLSSNKKSQRGICLISSACKTGCTVHCRRWRMIKRHTLKHLSFFNSCFLPPAASHGPLIFCCYCFHCQHGADHHWQTCTSSCSGESFTEKCHKGASFLSAAVRFYREKRAEDGLIRQKWGPD